MGFPTSEIKTAVLIEICFLQPWFRRLKNTHAYQKWNLYSTVVFFQLCDKHKLLNFIVNCSAIIEIVMGLLTQALFHNISICCSIKNAHFSRRILLSWCFWTKMIWTSMYNASSQFNLLEIWIFFNLQGFKIIAMVQYFNLLGVYFLWN